MNAMITRIKILILTAVCAAGVALAVGGASRAQGATVAAGSAAELAAALADAGIDEIQLTDDLALTSALSVTRSVRVVGAKEDDTPAVITSSATANARHFTISGSAAKTVELGGLILDGGGISGGVATAGAGAVTLSGDVLIRNCSYFGTAGVRYDGGGGLRAGAPTDIIGSVTVEKCVTSNKTYQAAGGGVLVSNGIPLTVKGALRIVGCEAGGPTRNMSGNGGGMSLCESGTLNVPASGRLVIDDCHGLYHPSYSATEGGGIWAYQNAITFDGDVLIRNCSAANGGGIRGGVVTVGGTLTADGCRTAQSSGGGMQGGGLYGLQSLTVDGRLVLDGCNAGQGGGLQTIPTITVNAGGSMELYGCYTQSTGTGGGMLLTGSNIYVYGRLIVDGCAATRGGGIMMSLSNAITVDGEFILNGCRATTGAGGGLYTNASGSYHARLTINAGAQARVTNNRAPLGDGGGIAVSSVAGRADIAVYSTDAVFADNLAKEGYAIAPADIPQHDSLIKSAAFSYGLPYAYNNHDISYTAGTLITNRALTYHNGLTDTEELTLTASVPEGTALYVAPLAEIETLSGVSWAREGYKFLGWLPDTELELTDGEFAMPAGDLTFTAQWAMYHGVVFLPGADGGVTGLPEDVSAAAGDVFEIPVAEPARGGYFFDGWLLEGVTVTEGASEFVMPDNDVTFTALWRSPPPPVITVSPTPTPTSTPAETPTAPVSPTATPVIPTPSPSAPGAELTPGGNGYVEIGDDGTPLGEWHWDDGEWIYEPYPPLANAPRTGDAGIILPVAALIAAIAAIITFIVTRRRKKS